MPPARHANLAMEASNPSRDLTRSFFMPRLLAFRLLLNPRPAALNQNHKNHDCQNCSYDSDNHLGAHEILPFLPQLFGQ
jgi:hypothetical protein